MSDTGHKDIRMPGGKSLVEWITPTIRDECRHYEVETPTDRQIAIVISAMRMHTIIVHAANYDRSELGKPSEVTSYWPVESSIGRYFRDAASAVLRGDQS